MVGAKEGVTKADNNADKIFIEDVGVFSWHYTRLLTVRHVPDTVSH
jgi:hypothetical protein